MWNKDFINKLKITEEEADETIYFLQLLNESHPYLIQPLIEEGTEILKISVASINTTRNRMANASANK